MEVVLFAATWIHLEIIILSEVTQKEKDKCRMVSFLCIEGEGEGEVVQSCPTLCDPMDYSPLGSSVHGIFQARVLEGVAISFSRGSSRPRDQTQVSHVAGRCFTN